MKSFLCFLLFLCNSYTAFAQTFDVETIKGDINNNRINLVILSEGYQATELDKFKTDAESFVSDMFAQSPFLEYTNYFNVHIIKVPSNESGADHPVSATDPYEPGGSPKFVDTYFNATFDAFNIHRFLFYGIDYADAASAELKIISVLADNFPTYDQTLILVNSSEYGGIGGQFPISSTNSNEIAIHELGHSMFDLKDEYLLPDVFYGEAINMTQETNTSLVKWKNWINENGINIYPHGASGVPASWYKPQIGDKCKMEKLDQPFCSVCKEGIIEKIHSLISPINAFTPNSTTVDNLTFPLDFQLDLFHPTNKDLERVWVLNSFNFANEIDDISILEADLTEGNNTLTVIVHDNSPFLRVDNHDSFHVHTVTWTINYTSLGVDDILSSANNYNISLYPNPTNNILNLKFESSTSSNLKVDIISLDGKKVKSTSLSNYENMQVDISNLSQGVYITNFYASNVLIASKRLVKN